MLAAGGPDVVELVVSVTAGVRDKSFLRVCDPLPAVKEWRLGFAAELAQLAGAVAVGACGVAMSCWVGMPVFGCKETNGCSARFDA